MKIGALQKCSLSDYPGKMSAVVYTQGCNWRCPFCQNPELVLPQCFGEPISEDTLFSFLKRREDRLDGVVITGGEPTMHPDLLEFISKIKAMGFAVKLHTNGSNPGMLRELLHKDLLDFISMDLKAPFNNYTQVAGTRVQADFLRTSLWLVKNSGLEHELCTTVVPGLHTTQEIKSMANLVDGAKRYTLQEFNPENTLRPEYRDRPAFPRKAFLKLEKFFVNHVDQFHMRFCEPEEEDLPLAAGG